MMLLVRLILADCIWRHITNAQVSGAVLAAHQIAFQQSAVLPCDQLGACPRGASC
jgi:hypothetical protein